MHTPEPISAVGSLRRELFSPTVGRPRKLLMLLGVALLFMAFPVVISLPWLVDGTREYWAREPFVSARWKASLDADSNRVHQLRVRMVDDLLRKHRLVGQTRSEIEQLLGIPPNTPYFRNDYLVYWLGPRGLMSVDSEWLCIKFGGDQRSTQARILRD
jgi:hypothetical protein